LSTDNSIVFGGLNSTGVAAHATFSGGIFNDQGFSCVDTFNLERR
jgi:hypothetical protein